MDRRSFIKSIAAATTAPLALLKAEPTLPEINHPPEEGVFEGFTWIPSHKPSAMLTHLEPLPQAHSRRTPAERYQRDLRFLAKYTKSQFKNHVTII